MTIQDIFNRMMLYDNERDLIAGGAEVSRGIQAINLVQDWWEAVAAAVDKLCQTYSTLVTVALQEYTAWPETLLRVDDIWLLDANGSQVRKLDPIDGDGDHIPSFQWPVSALTISGVNVTGAPVEYSYTSPGDKILWSPKPDTVYTVRVYGLWAKNEYAVATDSFLYPKKVALALAPFAGDILRAGLDRDLSAIESAAESGFKRVVKAMKRPVRGVATSRVYTEFHET